METNLVKSMYRQILLIVDGVSISQLSVGRTSEIDPSVRGADASIKPGALAPGTEYLRIQFEPAKRATAFSVHRVVSEPFNMTTLGLSPASAGLDSFLTSFLGLTPQALCFCLLRRLTDLPWAIAFHAFIVKSFGYFFTTVIFTPDGYCFE